MPKLLSRQKYIPGGFRYWIPSIKFQAPPNASFDVIVNAIIAARKANPALLQKYGWSTDYNTVADELDAFNSKLCADMGWTDYITEGGGGATAPFTQAHHPRSPLQNVVAGSKVLVEWIKSGAEAVPAEQANKRAAACAACPNNGKGDWTKWFTIPVSAAIRTALDDRRGMKLATNNDDALGICESCLCPLKLMVHVPLKAKLSQMTAESKALLHPNCWVLSEEKGLTSK